MMNQNRNLFRLTRFVLLRLPALFNLLAKLRKPSKRLLVIKTDAIGDYVLFRNFLSEIGRSGAYSGYEIDLLGNELWAELAESYDRAALAGLFFTRPTELYHAPLKTLRTGYRLFRRNYTAVLQPTYSRSLVIDGLAALTAAPLIIGFESDHEAIPPKYKTRTDRFYHRLLQLPAPILFEFHRTRFFFETVLSRPISLSKPELPVAARKRAGVIAAIGAGNPKRSWEPAKFSEVMRRLGTENGKALTIIGGPADVAIAAQLEKSLSPLVVNNLAGKTGLVEMVERIASSELLITNETSALHIAEATATPAVCILGGGHFERFAPYPVETQSTTVFVYDKLDCFYCNWNCLYQTPPESPFPCIGTLTTGVAWNAVEQQLRRYSSSLPGNHVR